MSNVTILYAGIASFSLIVLCLVLTMYEFNKLEKATGAGKREI
jgi:hypothetical protein